MGTERAGEVLAHAQDRATDADHRRYHAKCDRELDRLKGDGAAP